MSPTKVPRNLDPECVRQGETLRAFRQMRGIKVGELASLLDISYAYLSNIEAGRKRLTPPLLAKASDILDVRPAALVRPDHFTDERATA